MGKIIRALADTKNRVFLSTCLCVHVAYLSFFWYSGATALAVLNAISASIYVTLLVSKSRDKDVSIVIAFFEILVFSMITETLLHEGMGFIFYSLGMVAVIFYLVELDKYKIMILQLFGILATIAIFFIDTKDITVEIGPQVDFSQEKNVILFVNILVALGNMLYVSLLYIDEQEKNKATLEYNMNHDQLTGLYNRRFFYSHVKQEDENPENYAIAMIDIDNFKKINDNYGHKTGDAALVSLSMILQQLSSPKDVVVRWGGEEFIIFMPETDEKMAYEKLLKIQDAVRNNKTVDEDQVVSFTVTIGLAVHDDLADYEKVINDADLKLYEGKNNGKNKIVK